MRLDEISVMNTEYPVHDLTPEQISTALAHLSGGEQVAITQGGKLAVFQKNDFFVLMRGDDTCGWVKLPEKEKFFEFELIYFFEKFRKGPYVPALLHAVKSLVAKPIYFEPDSVLYKDGSALLLALVQHSMAKIKVLHANGSEEPFKNLAALSRTDALMLEDVLPLAFPIPVDIIGTKKMSVVSFFED